MKKFLTSVIALIMIFALMLTLVGCGDESPKFIGKWSAKIDMTQLLNDRLSTNQAGKYIDIDEFAIKLNIEFKENNVYVITVDEKSVEQAFDGLKQDFIDAMQKSIDDMGLNITVDELMKKNNTTIDKLFEESFGEEMIESLIDEFATKGKYDYDKNLLYLSVSTQKAPSKKEGIAYEFVNDNEVKLTSVVNNKGKKVANNAFGKFLPITLKRI